MRQIARAGFATVVARYQAVRGNGGTVRLVFLPHEAHGYRAKETVEHVLYEKFAWFNKYLKGGGAGGAN